MLGKLALLAMLGGIACGQGEVVDTGEITLVDHQLWEVVEPSIDPYWSYELESIVCLSGAFGAEGEGNSSFFEVQTADCNYLTVSQPSLAVISKGSIVRLSLWHLPLAALKPAEALISVGIDGRTIFEEKIAIPAEDAVYSLEFTADFNVSKGSRIVFHVHNHGINSWRFHRFTVTP